MDTEPPTIVRYVQTCCACPSQWNAWDAGGQYYYLRYRFGRGTVETAASADDYVENGPTAQVAAFLDGDPMQGEIELDEFLRLAGMRLADDAHREPDAPQFWAITGTAEQIADLYPKPADVDDLEAFLATTWTPPPISDEPADVIGSMRTLRHKLEATTMQPQPPLPPVHPVTGWPFEGLIRTYRESEQA